MRQIIQFILVALVVLVCCTGVQAISYGNQTDTDTLPLSFQILDTLCKPVAIAAGDSLFVAVYSPSGTVVYKDSVLGNNAGIKVQDWEDIPDDYTFPKLVSVLNGSATTFGTYVVKMRLYDVSLALPTSIEHSFTLISANLNTLLARLDAAISTRSTFASATDSVLIKGLALAATAGAITAVTLADDAIDYGTFAATAPTAWWNEGKTGYTVSTVSDKTGYALTTSYPDSAMLSRISGRKIWGIAAGSGSDSVGYVNRHVNMASASNNAITANAIADDAIDYATFAATAPTGWWPEGKTGYSLSGTTDANVVSVADNAINLATDVTDQLPDSNVADIAVVIRDTTTTARRLPDSTTVFSAMWQLLNDSCLTENGLDSLVDSVCGGGVAGPDSATMAKIVGLVLHDSTGWAGRAVWRTLLAVYDTANGTFGQMNNGSGWFDPASQAVTLTDTTKSGDSVATTTNIDDNPWDNATRTLTAFDEDNMTIDINATPVGQAASVAGAVGSVAGAVGSVTGAVGSVTGNMGGNVVGSVGSVAGNVTGSVGSVVGNVTGSVGSVVGNVGGNVVGSVASVTGNVGGNVTGSTGSVTGAVGSVTGAVGSVTGKVTLVDSSATDISYSAAQLDTVLSRIMFHLKAAALWPGSNFTYRKHATVDTLIIIDTVSTPDDTLLYVIRKHLAGPAGGVPDSGATVAGPGF